MTMPEVEPVTMPLAHRRLYSPGVLAAYTALGNLATGCVLYGLNLRARGRAGAGAAAIAAGLGFGALLLMPSASGGLRAVLLVLSLIGAINVYHLERRPYAQALRAGARPARWWPPALILIALAGGLSLVAGLVDSAA